MIKNERRANGVYFLCRSHALNVTFQRVRTRQKICAVSTAFFTLFDCMGCRFRVYSDLRIIFFVNVKSLQTFSSWFWYQWIALDKLYPTLLCASCQDIFVRRRMVFRTAPVTHNRRRNVFCSFFFAASFVSGKSSSSNSFFFAPSLRIHLCEIDTTHSIVPITTMTCTVFSFFLFPTRSFE